MARTTSSRKLQPILDAAKTWIERCLIDDLAVFSQETIWTLENVQELKRAFVDNLDEGEGSFSEKLDRQLGNSPPAARRLMAEMRWILGLFPTTAGAETKRAEVLKAWEFSGDTLSPDHVLISDKVLEGIGSAGTAYNTHRWRELRYLIFLLIDLKSRSTADRRRIFSTYDQFMVWIEGVPRDGSRQFRHILRYFAFPDRVERISSNRERRRILRGFGLEAKALEQMGDVELDTELAKVRVQMESEYPGETLDFFEAPLRERWEGTDEIKTTQVVAESAANYGPGDGGSAIQGRLWLIGTGEKAGAWPLFLEGSCIAMDWPGVGDLRGFATKDAMALAIREAAPDGESVPINDALACWQFSREIQRGDLVIAKEGRSRLLGLGRVCGDYHHQSGAANYRDRLGVEWLKTGVWDLPGAGMPAKTLTEVISDKFRSLLADAIGGFDVGIPELAGGARHHWWMNINPRIWDVEAVADGHVELFTVHNEAGRLRNLPEAFDGARAGDIVLGYSTSPRKWVAVLCEITKAKHMSKAGPAIEFKKIRTLKRAVTREEMLADERLSEVGALKMPRGSLFPLKDAEFDVILELAENGIATVEPYALPDAYRELFMSPEKLGDILQQLRRKLNVVLQGPPGVGKTFAARRLAYLLLGGKDDSRIEMVQFHPSTSYEDFVVGLRPDGKGSFAFKPGTFHRFCRRAQGDPGRPYVFIIDEINRANLAKVFGELMMLIESDKRGEDYAVPLNYAQDQDEKFYLPSNLYVIGTMNTADRSLALVDYALRRRFAFITLEPDFGQRFQASLRDRNSPPVLVDKICTRIAALNDEICKDVRSLGRGYQIGHSFFCGQSEIVDPEAWYREVINFEVKPLLEEYWMDDSKRVESEIKKLLE